MPHIRFARLSPHSRSTEIESPELEERLPVRLFIGNLPYSASEAELRAHFAAIAEPSHVVMPVDRETGRPRGFAFVEFADREVAEQVIQKFNAQPFQGRNLAVSEARAREDRPPGSRPPGGGFGGPRPGGGFGAPRPGGGGFGGPRPGGFGGPRPGGPGGPPPGPGGRDRSANFGPPAPPKRLRGKKGQQQEHKPRGPIKERTGGRIYDVEDLGDNAAIDFDDFASSKPNDTDDDKE
jgi:cold-inducible RNA-binding protein